MSFLSTAFLLALPLVAAPLLLHLFDRRRNRVIEWGAMEFLMEASTRKTSARRLKQWLLLLLRCLAIAALIFALARPLLPSGYLGGSQRGETIFVIDNSMSMMRTTSQGTMMQNAIDHAIKEMSELPRGESIRVMTAAPYPVWSGTGGARNDQRTRGRIESQLRQLSATEGRSDLLAALFTAVQAEHDPTQSSRRIVILTDGQAADWGWKDQAGWKRFGEVLNSTPVRTEVETVRLDQAEGLSAKGNVAMERLSIGHSIVGVSQPVTVYAHVRNYDAPHAAASPLVWQVNGVDEHDEMMDAIEMGQSREAKWVHSFDTPGTYRLSCRIDQQDDLPADNIASLVVEVVDRVPIVIVEDAFELAEMQQDSYFVQAALGWIDGAPLDDKSVYVPTLVSPAELATTDLSHQRVVVIPNLTRLDEDSVERLGEFVSNGGGLWIGLGPRTDVDAFNHQLFADASGLSPLRIDRIVDTAPAVDEPAAEDEAPPQRRVYIDPFRSDHSATRQLTDDKQLDLADALIQRRFQFVATNNDDLSVLLRLSNDQPLAAENLVGRGRVIVQAVPLRLQWTDLARTQSFVVMVRDWIDYLAQPRATQYNLQPGEPIVMRLAEPGSTTAPEEAPTALLTTPAGDAVELTAERRDDAFVFRSSRTRLPGRYKLEVGLAEQSIPFHVRRDVGESDLKALGGDVEKQIAAATTANPSNEQLEAAASTLSDPVWPYLLFGLIVLITGELVLSGVLARERFGSAGIAEFSELDVPLDATLGGEVIGSAESATAGEHRGDPVSTEVN
ncbi:MAG: BatA domain-containing protein [Pirellulales bacterium]|nr:BatA domain-containing protein [Pirellulales bacterium]